MHGRETMRRMLTSVGLVCAVLSLLSDPIECYPAALPQTRAIQLMIMNNLDARVAQFPAELITYGGNGSVLSNWAQFHLLMQYLSTMGDEQTLSMSSGHPAGLFPAPSSAPRVVISNGMVIPNYSSAKDYTRMYAMGNSMYGQMTAGRSVLAPSSQQQRDAISVSSQRNHGANGQFVFLVFACRSWVYIGPQGIVHGTTITILNAGRKYLSSKGPPSAENILAGKVYVSSGLGGMSGAQGKAGKICGCISVIAEIDPAPLQKRLKQGWIDEACDDLEVLVKKIKEARASKIALAIGYQGNIVDLWERLVQEDEPLVEIGSDQTSLHNLCGGYMPVGLTFQESQTLMREQPDSRRPFKRV
jgi:urocanate hydratase